MTMDRAERQRSKSPAYPGTRYKGGQDHECRAAHAGLTLALGFRAGLAENADNRRSEEHTSELQSQSNLVCRLLLEKKKNNPNPTLTPEQTPCITNPRSDRPHRTIST